MCFYVLQPLFHDFIKTQNNLNKIRQLTSSAVLGIKFSRCSSVNVCILWKNDFQLKMFYYVVFKVKNAKLIRDW